MIRPGARPGVPREIWVLVAAAFVVALGLTSLPLSAAALVMFANLDQIAPSFAAEMAPTLFTGVLALEIIGPIVAKAALHAVREDHPT